MRRKKTSEYLAGLIGHLLEHYDTALFGLLTPFLAPLFFPHEDPIISLAMTFAIHPLAVAIKPLGALFFGYLGDFLGRKKALVYSMVGTACITVLAGCLPTYQKAGPIASILLALVRIGQAFFAAGESTNGAIFVLEKGSNKDHPFLSSLVSSATIIGILLASFSVTLCCTYGEIQNLWRYLFFGGGLLAVAAFFLRNKEEETPPKILCKKIKVFSLLKTYKIPIIQIALLCGFSHITYTFSFTLLNGFAPMVTNLSKEALQQSSTFLLLIDLVFLLFFGKLSSRFAKEKVMLFGAIFSSVIAFPLFSYLSTSSSILQLLIMRSLLVIGGVAFAAPYYALCLDLLPKEHRCLLLSLASSIGAKFFGAPAATISLLLYSKFGSTLAPAMYLVGAGCLASMILYLKIKKYSPSLSG